MGWTTCKEHKHLSEDFIIEGATEFWLSLKKSNFFNIGDGLFFYWAFFVRNMFPSNNSALDFIILQAQNLYT